MSTYSSILYHIIFATKNRAPLIHKKHRPLLYGYIESIILNKKCLVHAVNGTEDHIHIAASLHPAVALSNLVKDIKVATTIFMKSKNETNPFPGWQVGYGAFTLSMNDVQRLVNYIRNQERHHMKKDFRKEYTDLLEEHHVSFDPKYLF